MAQAMAASWGGPATVKTYAGEGHDLPSHPGQAGEDIRAYLQQLRVYESP